MVTFRRTQLHLKVKSNQGQTAWTKMYSFWQFPWPHHLTSRFPVASGGPLRRPVALLTSARTLLASLDCASESSCFEILVFFADMPTKMAGDCQVQLQQLWCIWCIWQVYGVYGRYMVGIWQVYIYSWDETEPTYDGSHLREVMIHYLSRPIKCIQIRSDNFTGWWFQPQKISWS